MALKETNVDDVKDLVAHLLANATAGTRWFRGQGCHRRQLKPSLARRIGSSDINELLASEQRLLTRFRQRSLPFWPEGYPQTPWEHLFAMQHYGVPTRLLDWSENSLIGTYFAADHDPARCECGNGDCKVTLWVLDPVAFNRSNPRFAGYGDSIGILATSESLLDPWKPGVEGLVMAPDPVALFGTHNSTRIVAQQGTFTVSGKSFEPLESAPEIVAADNILEKITLNQPATEVMRDLKILGIHRSTVFPGLEGLGYDISEAELR